MKNNVILILCVLSILWLSLSVLAQSQEMPPITVEKVSGNVYCIYGPGGNIGVLATEDGLLVVDSQMEQSAPEVLKQIATISPKPIKYLVITHYHGDHTDGAGVIGKDAVIIMHPNCRASLVKSLEAKGVKKEYLSKIKDWTPGMVLELGGEKVDLLHFGSGHTAGDLVVVFEKAKVFHTGDLFFHGMPPYIDVADGADTGNWIHTIETLCKKYPGYKIIPGHGKVTDQGEYIKFAGYLTYMRKEVAAAIAADKTREQAMETINLEPYRWMKDTSEYTKKKNNIGWIYDEMTREKK